MKKIFTNISRAFSSGPARPTLPEGFVLQILEPTGGKILRPKDWFYSEGHRGPVYMWTLSREDQRKEKGYTTGVRIQVFNDVLNGTGKTAKQFILDFIASKKQEAIEILKTSDEMEQYLFTGTFLETIEGPDHILYSLFWGTNAQLDSAIIAIYGTTKELWNTYKSTFEKMFAFEIIDMKRFEK